MSALEVKIGETSVSRWYLMYEIEEITKRQSRGWALDTPKFKSLVDEDVAKETEKKEPVR